MLYNYSPSSPLTFAGLKACSRSSKRQKLPEHPQPIQGQLTASTAVAQHSQPGQHLDFLDELLGDEEQACNNAVEVAIGEGQLPCQACPAVSSPVGPSLQPADAAADSSQPDASARARQDPASAVGTPTDALPIDPEAATLPSTLIVSPVSKDNPWAKDVFEVFKQQDLDFSQASLALILKDMPSAQRTALLSHSRFSLESITKRWSSSKAFTDELDSYQAFRETALKLEEVEHAYKVHHVEDMRKFFRQLLVKNAEAFDPEARVLRDAAGMRFYNGFNTGGTLESMQVCARGYSISETSSFQAPLGRSQHCSRRSLCSRTACQPSGQHS
ncbi:g2767 [Coccomyxa viridis]|uniref:G2767 protein n=1 Tax=Coccomyxa viridis TaxID=1274662 RepID=A0ABP1FL69_9CHLO